VCVCVYDLVCVSTVIFAKDSWPACMVDSNNAEPVVRPFQLISPLNSAGRS